jgi:hypothetical protein
MILPAGQGGETEDQVLSPELSRNISQTADVLVMGFVLAISTVKMVVMMMCGGSCIARV